MADVVNMHRRQELTKLAKKSRIRWILESREKESSAAPSEPSLKPLLPSTSACIQSVFDFLSDILNDGESFDVDTISLGLLFLLSLYA